MILKFIKEVHSLVWTIAGTLLVLITLSGRVRSYGLTVSGVSLALHFLGMLIKNKDD